MNEYSEISIFILTIFSGFILIPIWLGLVHRKMVDVFEPIYPLIGFYFLLFVLQPFILINSFSPLTQVYAFPLAILYAMIGILAFYIGYYSRLGIIISKHFPSFRPYYSIKRLFAIVFLFTMIGVVALSWFLYRVFEESSITWALTHPLEFNNKYLKTGSGYITWGISLLQISFFLLYGFSLEFRQTKIKVLSLIYLLLVIPIYFIFGTRWLIIVTLLIPIIIRHYYLNSRVRLWHVLILTPFLIGLFGFLNLYRGLGEFTIPGIPLFEFLIGTLSGDLLTPFDNFVILIQAIDSGLLDFSYGRYYFYLLITPVPRALWPSKPIVSVEWAFTEAVFGWDPRVGPTRTMTIPGELYYNLHIAGIILGMAVWGVFWRAMYAYLLRNRRNIGVVLLYALLLSIGFNAIRTAIEVFIISALMNTVPVLVAMWYMSGGKLIKLRKNQRI
jgi:oligosaccharide repeat unit polymerase